MNLLFRIVYMIRQKGVPVENTEELNPIDSRHFSFRLHKEIWFWSLKMIFREALDIFWKKFAENYLQF